MRGFGAAGDGTDRTIGAAVDDGGGVDVDVSAGAGIVAGAGLGVALVRLLAVFFGGGRLGDLGVCGELATWMGVDALAAGVVADAGGVKVEGPAIGDEAGN